MRIELALLTAIALSTAAFAADVEVIVHTPDGAPVANAVVSVPGDLSAVPAPAEMPSMEQRDQQFNPFVLVVREGAEVVFPNRDRVRHHVYSFARGNRFELELYGREEERTVRFEVAGGVPIGCNIHDDMLAFIRVVDTPHAVVTDATGTARLSGISDGAQTVTVWHPYARGRNNLVTVELADGQDRLDVVIDITAPD
jgi:plastocyanin